MIDERIPGLSDKELETLQANAVRLAQSGTKVQQIEAGRLLPIIIAELEQRATTKAAAAEAKRTKQRELAAATRKSTPKGGALNREPPKD